MERLKRAIRLLDQNMAIVIARRHKDEIQDNLLILNVMCAARDMYLVIRELNRLFKSSIRVLDHALCCSSYHGHIRTCQELIKLGAKNLYTAIRYAEVYNENDVVQYLVTRMCAMA